MDGEIVMFNSDVEKLDARIEELEDYVELLNKALKSKQDKLDTIADICHY